MAEEQTQPTQAPEPAESPAPKKKGKLPTIIMLAVLLGAGGFFGMKMRHKGVHKAPEVKLGETLKLQEFLVNLGDGKTYLRTEITLHLKEGVKIEDGGATEGGGGPEMPIIRNAIINVLTNRHAGDISTLEGKRQLRRDIASAINEALDDYGAEKTGSAPPKIDAKAAGQPLKHPDWDSDTGPILKVYFTNFATQ